jgi:hypothetical protein
VLEAIVAVNDRQVAAGAVAIRALRRHFGKATSVLSG